MPDGLSVLSRLCFSAQQMLMPQLASTFESTGCNKSEGRVLTPASVGAVPSPATLLIDILPYTLHSSFTLYFPLLLHSHSLKLSHFKAFFFL